MGCLIFGMIELAMAYSATCAHTLNIAWWNAFDITYAIFMRQFSRENVANNLHIAMAMLTKTHSCSHAILINDAQISPSHKLGVMVASKRKGVKALEPAMVGIASILGFSQNYHGFKAA